jgi:hypothetical protein
MANQKRNVLDDLIETARQLLEDLLDPDRKKRQKARVPVPVRTRNPREPYRNR